MQPRAPWAGPSSRPRTPSQPHGVQEGRNRCWKRKAAHMTMSSTETALEMASIAWLEMTALPLYIRAAAVGAASAEQQSICR